MFRRICFFFLFAVVVTVHAVGCDGGSGGGDGSSIVVFSDVHFNPFYDSAIFSSLVNATEDQWADIFSGSSVTEPQSWGNETNYPLLMKMLDVVQEEGAASPVVLFTGDILTHGFSKKFYTLYGSQDEAAMRAFTYKTVAFFVGQVRAHLSGIPVLFTLGNNDSYEGDYKIAPDGAFLSDTADLFYSTFLLEEADHNSYYETYSAGGYYSMFNAQSLDSNLVVISLNSILFSVNASSGMEDAAALQLTWLEQMLASASSTGKRVWILMHIPPGADIYSTVNQYMDSSGHISGAAMMWKVDYQDSFLNIVQDYSDVIDMIFSGHTHMDEYRLANEEGSDSHEAVIVTPSISPLFGNDSAFKVMTVSSENWKPLDYRSVAYHFGDTTPSFATYYTFLSAYDLNKWTLDSAFAALYPELDTEAVLRKTYTGFYYSGHASANPINDTNWLAYWCGIAKMTKNDYIQCVNVYR